MNKVRKIIYTYDFRSYYKRHVGETLNVNIDGKPYTITIEDIKEEPNPNGMTKYLIFVKNDAQEIALWKTVTCTNLEAEYDIYNLLKP